MLVGLLGVDKDLVAVLAVPDSWAKHTQILDKFTYQYYGNNLVPAPTFHRYLYVPVQHIMPGYTME